MGTWRRMADWAARERALDVAVVGAGFIGAGAVYQLERTPWTRPALVVNRTIARGVEAYVSAGYRSADVVVADDPTTLGDAVREGRPAVTSAGEIIAQVAGVDVVVEATGAMDYAARIVIAALDAGRHVVSMNAELDATSTSTRTLTTAAATQPATAPAS